MRIALEIARFEVMRVLRDTGAFFWIVAFPVIYASFFGMIQFTGSRSVSVGLCIADADSGFLARGLQSSLAKFSMELLDSTALAEYERRDGLTINEVALSDTLPSDCVRLLSIPAGFTDSLLHHNPVILHLTTGDEGAFMATITTQVMVWRAILENMAALIAASSDTSGGGLELQLEAQRARPQKVIVRSSFAGGVEQAPQGLSQTVPGTIVMMVLMILLTQGTATLVLERKQGLLLHISATPATRSEIIWGKLLGRYLTGGVQIVILWILMVAAQHLLGVWIGYRLIETVPLLAIYALAASGVGFFVAALVRSIDTAVGIGITVTLVMAALGGCWWPLEIVPRGMQIAGHAFPTAWAMDALHQLMAYNHGLGSVVPQMAILALYGIVFSAAASRVLRLT